MDEALVAASVPACYVVRLSVCSAGEVVVARYQTSRKRCELNGAAKHDIQQSDWLAQQALFTCLSTAMAEERYSLQNLPEHSHNDGA
jgi:hypothetical protein